MSKPVAPPAADSYTIGSPPLTGQDLAAWRARTGLSQRALANLIDVPQSTVARWETGRCEILHPVILALALAELERRIRRK